MIIPDFDESTHEYRVDGKRKASVTQILDIMGLVSPFAKSDSHASRGTRIHRILELHDLDKLNHDWLDDKEIACIKYWDQFKSDFNLDWIGVETRFYNPELDYCGTVDRIGRELIVDIKTGTIPKSAALQTAGYAMGVSDDPIGLERLAVIINPRKHKSYKLGKPMKDPGDFLEWQNIVNEFHRRMNEHGDS